MSKKKTSMWQGKFRTFKRVGTLAVAATFALSVPTVSNVVSKVAPSSFNTSVAHAESSNMMDVKSANFNVVENEDKEHHTHTFHNDGSMQVESEDFDLTDLKYIVKFPDELSDLLDNEYMTEYLLGNVENFGSAQTPFNITGQVIDKDGEKVSINKDEHKPYNFITINHDTNSVEFDFDSFYTDNELEPVIEKNVNGDYIFETLGFETPIVVHDDDMLDNGTYEFKSAIVRGDSVDLDNVSGAHSETLEVDYNNDPDPEPDVDKSALEELVEDVANEYDEDDYTEDSFNALSDAIEEAENVLEDEDADQDAVDNALNELNTAIDNLEKAPEPEPDVDKSELDDLVDEANEYNGDDYTEDSFDTLTNAIDEAEEVLNDEDADQEEVNAALNELQDAIDDLEKAPEPDVDKSELKNLVDEAKNHNADDYTDDSFNTLTSSIEKAKSVLNDDNANKEEVEKALKELNAAIKNLEKASDEEPESEVNKDDLEKLVENLDDYNADKYTDDSFSALAAAFDHAQKVLDNEDATQKEVDKALKTLQDAIDNLVEKSEVDKSELIALLEDAKSYDADAYGKNTFKVLIAAINKAEEVIDDVNATQKEVDAAFKELRNAIENLVETADIDRSNTTDVVDSVKSEGDTLPDTATNNPLFILIGVSMVTLGGVLYFVRRKKTAQ